jgi:hypothetical protein
MFDFITRRRLIVGVFAVLFVIVSIIFITQLHSTLMGRVVPSYYQFSVSNTSTNNEQPTSTCYLSEPVDVITLCQKCTSYERRSKSAGCSPTGYRETVLCSKSNIKTARSCQIPIYVQRKHFWFFEGFVFILGLFSIASVQSRQKTLDKQMSEKIKRQIGEADE